MQEMLRLCDRRRQEDGCDDRFVSLQVQQLMVRTVGLLSVSVGTLNNRYQDVLNVICRGV